MKNSLSIFLVLLFFSFTLTAQPNAVYLELLGNGFLGSINYEKQIVKSTPLTVRVGAGILGTSTHLTVPVSVNYLFKLIKKNQKLAYLETGFGVTYTQADVRLYAIFDDKTQPIQDYSNWNIVPSAGFRFYVSKNYFLRLAATPVINYHGLIPYFGWSIGRSFKKKY